MEFFLLIIIWSFFYQYYKSIFFLNYRIFDMPIVREYLLLISWIGFSFCVNDFTFCTIYIVEQR